LSGSRRHDRRRAQARLGGQRTYGSTDPTVGHEAARHGSSGPMPDRSSMMYRVRSPKNRCARTSPKLSDTCSSKISLSPEYLLTSCSMKLIVASLTSLAPMVATRWRRSRRRNPATPPRRNTPARGGTTEATAAAGAGAAEHPRLRGDDERTCHARAPQALFGLSRWFRRLRCDCDRAGGRPHSGGPGAARVTRSGRRR